MRPSEMTRRQPASELEALIRRPPWGDSLPAILDRPHPKYVRNEYPAIPGVGQSGGRACS
jgi:hypothetical protein